MENSPPPTRPSTAKLAIRQDQQQVAELRQQVQTRSQALFNIAEEHTLLLEDAQVSKVVQFVVGLQDFMKQYIDGKEKIPPHMLQTPVQRIEGLKVPEDVQSQLKLTEVKKLHLDKLGEILFSDNKANGTCFCVSIMHFQMLSNGTYFERLDTLFKMEAASGGSSPIPMAELVGVLPLNEITKSVVEMSKTVSNSTWMSDLYMGNILNKLNSGEKGKNLAEEVQKLEEQIASLNDGIIQCKWDSDKFNGQKEQLLDNEKRMKAMADAGKDMKSYYEAELVKMKELLENAEADEKRYTYKCYGPFSWVWQNDVDLAKDKVKRYTENRTQLEKQVEKAQTENNDLSMQAEKKEFVAKLAEAQANINKAAAKIEEASASLKRISEVRDGKLRALVKLMQNNGCDSVNELLNAMDAMKAVGQASSSQSQTGTVVLAGWVKDLNFLGVALNRIARADSFQRQKDILQVLKDWTLADDNKFCQFLRCIKPMTNIPYLKNREPYQRVNLPSIDVEKIAKTIDWTEQPLPAIEHQPGWADEPATPAEVAQIRDQLMEVENLADALPPVEFQMSEDQGNTADLNIAPDDYADQW